MQQQQHDDMTRDELFGKCAHCKKNIPNTMAFLELKCGKHIGCMSHNTLKCPVAGCGVADAIGQQQQQQSVPMPQHAMPGVMDTEAIKRKSVMARRAREPLNPPQPGSLKKFGGGVLRIFSKLTDAGKPNDESSDPFVLLREHVPLKDIVNTHYMDITELINDHAVTINDFFGNGYNMSMMCDAFSSRMNKTEGLSVLYNLGISAEHFFCTPDLVQVGVMQDKLGYTPEWLKHFGYKFVPGQLTIPQMMNVGLTMPLVMECGLKEKSEWTQLKATADSEDQLEDFGWTPQLENQLFQTNMASQLQQYGTPVPTPAIGINTGLQQYTTPVPTPMHIQSRQELMQQQQYNYVDAGVGTGNGNLVAVPNPVTYHQAVHNNPSGVVATPAFVGQQYTGYVPPVATTTMPVANNDVTYVPAVNIDSAEFMQLRQQQQQQQQQTMTQRQQQPYTGPKLRQLPALNQGAYKLMVVPK